MTHASTETGSIIEPYLNPGYWDGQFIGDGEARPQPDSSRDRAAASLAAGALHEYIARGASKVALRTFGAGDICNPDELEPGTILRAAAEKIERLSPSETGKVFGFDFLAIVINRGDQPKMSDFANQPPVNRPRLADEGKQLVGHGYRYTSASMLCVVTRQSRAGALYSVPESQVHGQATRRELRDLLERGPSPFTVGETSHTEGSNTEFLLRINELHLCANGAVQPARRSLLLPRLRLAPGAST
jgi:hypothetical protein